MGPVFDIIALRSLVAVADKGGFHRAAESLALSQSAVSQHVRRLEKTLGRPVVERAGRATRFTEAGALLLDEARWILRVHDEAARRLLGSEPATMTVGSAEHAADRIIPRVTAAVHRTRPRTQVRFRIDRSARLVEAVDSRSVDLAVYVTEAGAVEGMPVGGLPLKWYAAPGWTPMPTSAVLPVVAIEEPCAVRRRALEVLSAHNIPAAVVCDAGYLAGVLDAARAGLGVALLADTGRGPDGLVEYTGLPHAPAMRMSAHARPDADPALVMNVVEAVRSLLVEMDTPRPEERPDPAQDPDTARGDLTDDEWESVRPLLPLGERGPYPEGLRKQFDGVMWLFRTGGAWRNMPPRYGAWQTVHHRFQQWALAGTFQTLTAAATAGTGARGQTQRMPVGADSALADTARDTAATAMDPQRLATLEKAVDEERRLRDKERTEWSGRAGRPPGQ
ncbi:transcriptional regulator, LysR family [Actinobacteria bacterium OK074]|nr:transcriptional regulator, LysR family [Actinobacteria bacterium OK074]